MKRLLSIATALTIILSCMVFTVNAKSDSTVSLRIEGAEQNIFYGTVEMEITDNTTVADVLTYFDANNDDVTLTGADTGYVSAVNDEVSGAFGGWDGWYYAVNGSIPDVGISSYTVSEGDNIVLYYGDYPCQYPRIDISKFYKGIIKFESYDTTYDENWNATSEWTPISGATVTLGDSTYTTDEKGCIYADTTKLFGETTVQIEKKSSSGAPSVCRLEKDYNVMYNDINKDGKININDATALQKYLVGFKNLDDESLSVADVNNDNEIDILDVTVIQKMIAEIG